MNRYQMRDLLVSLPGLRREAAALDEVTTVDEPTETDCPAPSNCEGTEDCGNADTEECFGNSCLGGTECNPPTEMCICSDCFPNPLGAFTDCEGGSECQVVTDECRAALSDPCLRAFSEGDPCFGDSCRISQCDVDGDPSRRECVPMSDLPSDRDGNRFCLITNCDNDPCNGGNTICINDTQCWNNTCVDGTGDDTGECGGIVSVIDCTGTGDCGQTNNPGVAAQHSNSRELALSRLQAALRKRLGK
jgi:hypothetical protein